MGDSTQGSFDFEGDAVPYQPGDTVATALLRAGVLTFSRGPKYHRPRGPFCLAGACAQCHMRIDGEPNVAACETPVKDGLRVVRQNVMGSADRDLLRAVDFLYRDGLDHHHMFTSSRVLNAAAQVIARKLSGVGEVPDVALPVRPARVEAQRLVVIGAGPAGLAAAVSAARLGLRPLVLEARAEAGGHLLDGLGDDPQLGARTLAALVAEVQEKGELRLGTRAVGLYLGAPPTLLARDDQGLLQIHADRVILATGGTERAIPFETNDLPGVFGGRGLVRLVTRHGVRPGSRVVVVGSNPEAVAVARRLREGGLGVMELLDPAGNLDPNEDAAIRSGSAPVRAIGKHRVEALVVRRADGTHDEVACDLVAIAVALQPAFELAAEVGAHVEYRAEAGFAVVLDALGGTSVPWLFAAGLVTGDAIGPLPSGDLAGAAAAASLDPESGSLRRTLAAKAIARPGGGVG